MSAVEVVMRDEHAPRTIVVPVTVPAEMISSFLLAQQERERRDHLPWQTLEEYYSSILIEHESQENQRRRKR